MMLELLKCKIHAATVTQTDLGTTEASRSTAT